MKKIIKILTALTILCTTYTGISYIPTEQGHEVSAKTRTENYVPSRTEYYGFQKGRTINELMSTREYGTVGAECIVTVDLKGNKGTSNFRNSYKNSAKLKGTSTTGTDDKLCTYIQKKEYITVGYDKASKIVKMYDGQSRINIREQGQKRIYSTSIFDKNLLTKYRKLGYIKPNEKYLNVLITVNVKNPQLSQDKGYKKMKAFKRTPIIPSKNVVINNINANDGQDSVTVKGLKKGTELNIYNTKGQLMEVVKPKSSTYTIKMDKDEDISKYFETYAYEKATQIIFSRKEPNSVESYRIRYAIPKEKASVRTPYQEHSQIKDSGSVRASIFLTNDTKYGMKSTIEFYSMTGKYPAKYRIKKNGKTVHTIDVAKKDMKYDQYKNDYQVSIEVPAADIPIIQQALKPTSLTVAKSMTITAQMEGMKESYPVSFYLPKGSNSMDFVSYGEYFE